MKKTVEIIPEDLQLLMVLGGEDNATRPRTNKAIEVYREYGSIPVLLTGSHAGSNGLFLPKGQKHLSEQMRDYMLARDVKYRDIMIEIKSLDTVGNFYFPYEGGAFFPRDNLGLITDKKHMPRSKWLADKICGPDFNFIPIPSTSEYGIGFLMLEYITYAGLAYDLRNIANGNLDDLKNYMEFIHPFNARVCGNKPKFSLYGLLVNANTVVKRLGISLRANEIREN